MIALTNSGVRWGILGCGEVTEVKSGPALQKAHRSHVDCVMRRDAEKAADYAERHGINRWTSSAEKLLADPALTAIYIATPPASHAKYAIEALEAGKDVLVEKPMALTTADCDAMIAASRETGKKLCIAYYRRALPRFQKFRQIIDDGLIGAPRLVEVRDFRTLDAGPSQSWKLDPAIGGGGLFADTQSHTLDWLAHVFGDPLSVSGITKRQSGAYAAEDFVSFQIEFDGVAAVGLCAYASAESHETVIIHGSEGRAEMSFFRPSRIALSCGDRTELIDHSDPAHVHQPLVQQVVNHFLGEGPNPCDGQVGRRVTVMLEDIYRAAGGAQGRGERRQLSR
ncbi:Gfo/Idh/MocA family protein [Qingshengfaniella alkalisoli]|uniref:Gfo/Idh/MocA family oxidoreductase n=1 Tax=Qingshengfaniella alkalisoli TaxID=2599296 RepID=A0A5B8J0L1_9RHOB|nr:Gfo/Idh/MocA family oxidoreductase [Qingshengfaniella alkalisoli]QDY71323.1 Gfo/Idh/MocA family oxidoreductase [Qingshengfaniella alkalisoli]